jgi:TolA-binding protein
MDWLITLLSGVGGGAIIVAAINAYASRRKVEGEARREVAQGDLNIAEAFERVIGQLVESNEKIIALAGSMSNLQFERSRDREEYARALSQQDAAKQQLFQQIAASQGTIEQLTARINDLEYGQEKAGDRIAAKSDYIKMLEKVLLENNLPFPVDRRNAITAENLKARLDGVTNGKI